MQFEGRWPRPADRPAELMVPHILRAWPRCSFMHLIAWPHDIPHYWSTPTRCPGYNWQKIGQIPAKVPEALQDGACWRRYRIWALGVVVGKLQSLYRPLASNIRPIVKLVKLDLPLQWCDGGDWKYRVSTLLATETRSSCSCSLGVQMGRYTWVYNI